jgi:hypothetical protein
MNPTTQLKLCAAMFTVLWTGWMLWSSESRDGVHVIMLSICGIAAGYAWYRAMRWQFQRSTMPLHNEHPADFSDKQQASCAAARPIPRPTSPAD